MQLNRVLIVYKKSIYQIQAVEHRESRFMKLLAEGNEAVARTKLSHEQHYRTLDAIEQALNKLDVPHKAISREQLQAEVKSTDADLVISVGGDGTFLDASHYLDRVPLLGVNSATSSSFGHFCLANEHNLDEVIGNICKGHLDPERILRLEVGINGTALPEPVLNEVLICHAEPAGTSRYFITIEDQKEEQRSSGIWVGPPAGSTAALRAAGGAILPLTARRYQYVVREPWPRPTEAWKLTKGTLSEHETIRVRSGMRTGILSIDGSHITHMFGLGDEILVKAGKRDLIAFVNPEANSIFTKKVLQQADYGHS